MVTAGFIAEGDSEAILLKDESFISLLQTFNINSGKDLVINAGGKYNLYNPAGNFSTIQRRVTAWIEILKSKSASVIFFLLDFDNEDTCFTDARQKTFSFTDNIVIIAKQTLEAWYLADEKALSSFLKTNIQQIEKPEEIVNPFGKIKDLRVQYEGRGISDKKILTRDMIKSGFNLQRAAQHPACPSAAYFIKKLSLQNNHTPHD